MFPDPSAKSRRRFVERLFVVTMAVGASLPGLALAGAAGEPARQGAEAPPGAARPDAPTVLVLGDSLSAEYGLRRGSGWVERLAERLRGHAPRWQVANASISGETTAGGRSRVDSLLRRHRPEIVVVELGGNDALRGLDLRATESNLDAIVAACTQAKARVLVLGMQVPPNYGTVYADAFAAIFPRVAKRHGASLVPFFLDAIAQRPELFQADRIHPTEAAQQALFETVWPALQPLLRASAAR